MREPISIIADELAEREPRDRLRFLVQLIEHAARGVRVILGPKGAASWLRDLADSIERK